MTSMLKMNSKKKRSRWELQDVKEEEQLLRSDKQEFLREFKRMKKELYGGDAKSSSKYSEVHMEHDGKEAVEQASVAKTEGQTDGSALMK